MDYKINEIFYSLKGEGRWTGTPMSFIRLAGCNLNCSFCDTLSEVNFELNETELLKRIALWPTSHVVITGGEPLTQHITPLVKKLVTNNFQVHLETNGTLPLSTNLVSWVAVSPKNTELNDTTIAKANEVKFLVGIKDWRYLIDYYIRTYGHKYSTTKLYVMPLAKSIKEGDRSASDILEKNVKKAMEYCLEHPEFSYCHQLHKVLGIR
jgi:organic radical activating enzyme